MNSMSEGPMDTAYACESRALIGRGQQSPLVGRTQERTRLHNALLEAERCQEGRADVFSWVTPARAPLLILSGSVGIGKTRLAEEASRDADQRGWIVFWSRAYAQEAAPYQFWVEMVRQVMKLDLWSDICASMQPDELQPLTVLVPEVAQYLPSDTSTLPAFPFVAWDEMVPLKLWDALLRMIIAVCTQCPVVIVLDDLQWVDQSSCDLLSYLCRHLVNYPVVLLGTCREESAAVFYPFRSQLLQLQRELLVTVLHLPALTDGQIARLVSSVKDPDTVQRIQSLASGNPFFAEELARVVQQNTMEDGAAKNAAHGEPVFSLPKTITDVFEQRLLRLSPACLNALRVASVFGGAFSCTTVLEMLRHSGLHVDEDEVLTLMEEALQLGLITEQGEGMRVRFLFWHPLLVRHLYENIFGARRALLHRRAARVLRQEYAGHLEEGAATILHHCLQGDDESSMIAYFAELTGLRAYSLCAFVDAERYFRLTLRTLATMTQDTLASTPEQERKMLALQEYLAECLRIQGRFREANEVYTHILEVHQQQALPLDAEQRHLAVQYQALLLAHIGKTFYDQAAIEQAFHCYQRAEQLLKGASLRNGTVLAYLRYTQSYNHLLCGAYAQARRLALQACKLLEDALRQKDQQHENVQAMDIIACSPLHRILGGDALDMAGMHVLLGKISSVTGHCGDGLRYFKQSLAVYEQHDSKQKLAMVSCDLGDVYLRRAEYARAREMLQHALRYAESTQNVPLVSFIFLNLCIVGMRCGDLADAEMYIRQAMTLVERYDNALALAKAAVYNYYALLLIEQGKLAEAQSMLCSALSMARKLRLRPFLAFTSLSLSQLRLTQAQTLDYGKGNTELFEKERLRLMRRAQHTLEHLLTLHDIEIESKCECQIALLEIALLTDLTDLTHAQIYEQMLQLRRAVRRAEVVWLMPRLERLLGTVTGMQGDYERAARHFDQALELAYRYTMQLECARTLRGYAQMFSEIPTASTVTRARAIEYLEEAHAIFSACGSMLDLQRIKHTLSRLRDNA